MAERRHALLQLQRLPIRVEIIARCGTRNCPETLGFFFHQRLMVVVGDGDDGGEDKAKSRGGSTSSGI